MYIQVPQQIRIDIDGDKLFVRLLDEDGSTIDSDWISVRDLQAAVEKLAE